MKFHVEAWAPEYGSSVEGTELDTSPEEVDAGVEVPAGDWEPLTPDPPAERPAIAFLDGVRRIDARVWIDDGGVSRPGVCATVAAGAVVCRNGSAVCDRADIERVMVAAAPSAGPVVTRHGTYQAVPVADDSPEGLYLGVHNRMIALEQRVAGGIDVDLVVIDGPLRDRDPRARDVGYVKTHHVSYLPPELQQVVGRLAPGERTPLFLIGGRFTRWSWYLQLPGPKAHPLAGVVRCELPGLGTAADAAERAGLVSSLLPRFASQPHKDTRAPQNLHPIAGLERELRRRLGDQALMERALRRAASLAA